MHTHYTHPSSLDSTVFSSINQFMHWYLRQNFGTELQ